jgi:hypothetical protein
LFYAFGAQSKATSTHHNPNHEIIDCPIKSYTDINYPTLKTPTAPQTPLGFACSLNKSHRFQMQQQETAHASQAQKPHFFLPAKPAAAFFASAFAYMYQHAFQYHSCCPQG